MRHPSPLSRDAHLWGLAVQQAPVQQAPVQQADPLIV